MASERMQRRLERLLDQIDEAETNGNWESVRDLALDVLAAQKFVCKSVSKKSKRTNLMEAGKHFITTL